MTEGEGLLPSFELQLYVTAVLGGRATDLKSADSSWVINNPALHLQALKGPSSMSVPAMRSEDEIVE